MECWSGGVVRSPRWLPWIVKRFGEMRVRVGDETVNGQVARWPHRQDACATKFLCAARFFAKFGGAHFHHELSGCYVFLVFLVPTDLGRIETPLRRSGGVRLENCANGRGGIAEVARTGGMVLPAQRLDEPLALHVAERFLRTGFAGIFGAQSCGRGGARSWNQGRFGATGAFQFHP